MRLTKIRILFGITIFVVICLFVYFIWPTPYRYISSPLISPVGDYYKQETNVPLRFNRLTNKGDYFLRGRWISSRDLLELASLIESLQARDRWDKKIEDDKEKNNIFLKEMGKAVVSGIMEAKMFGELSNSYAESYIAHLNSSVKAHQEINNKILLWEKRHQIR